MGLVHLLTRNPLAFVLVAVPLLYSIIIHEVAHGWVANRMGDPTAKWSGRLSLNPIKHLDPIGTLMLFLVGFGWAKPVPVNINNIPDLGRDSFSYPRPGSSPISFSPLQPCCFHGCF